ncbi:MAG: DUF6263 family protein [Bacteroidota bacterium]|nr:DUF6263 family protein [Bacteroidota bacterium]
MKKIVFLIYTLLLIRSVSFSQVTGIVSPAKGQKFVVENSISTVSTTEMAGQPMESKANISSTYQIEVKDIIADKFNLVNTVTHLKLSANAMGQDINFDSDKKEDMEGDIGKNFKDFINKPKEIVMDRSGNIIVPNKADTGKENNSSNPADMIIGGLAGDPEQQGFGAKMAFETIPKNAKAGTTWRDSSSSNGITKVTNYTLKTLNGNEAAISLSGTIDSEIKTEMQGMEIQTKTKGTFTGEETVDTKTGVVKQNTTTTDAKGTLIAMGQEIPTTSKITSQTTVRSL